MEKILLFRWGGLGDLFVALPSIQLIQKKFPIAKLTLVCRKRYGEIFEKTGAVAGLVDVDSPLLLPLFVPDYSYSKEASLKPYFQAFDLVFGWFSGQRKKDLERSLNREIPGPSHLFYYDARSEEPVSFFFFRKTFEALGGGDFTFEECSRLNFSSDWPVENSRRVIQNGPKDEKLIVIHPGSGGKEKCWPLDRYLAIVERLGRSQLTGILVTGEAETAMRPILEETILPEGWSWVHCPSLLELCGFLRKSKLYIGNDSGVTHLAAACGTKVIALFQASRERAWRPFGRVRTITADSLEEIDVEKVWKEICFLLPLA